MDYAKTMQVELRGVLEPSPIFFNNRLLCSLWEELQLSTIEASDPNLNLITFAQSATYSAYIVGQDSILQKYSSPVLLGLVYLKRPQNSAGLLGENILDMGIIISPEYRGKGYGQKITNMLLQHAFEVLQCHRVQVTLVHHPDKFIAQALFARMNFTHEGTRRRAFMSPFDLEWKDVTQLAMLETDWLMRSYAKKAPHSLWDELFARHHREREDLLLWEEEKRMRTPGPSDKTLMSLKAMRTLGDESLPSWNDGQSVSGEDSEYDRCSISTLEGDDTSNFTDDDVKEFDGSPSPPDLADFQHASASTGDERKGMMDVFLCR